MPASRAVLVSLLLVALLGPAAARAGPQDARVAWLRAHAAPVRTIDPTDADFRDLEGLRAMIGDARIVQLGEASHGDGASLRAKTRIVRFLHERMGFSVLAFESGIYGCHRTWRQLQAGRPALDAAREGLFPVWTRGRAIRPLLNYLASLAPTSHPLEVCGFDTQITGEAAERRLLADLQAHVHAVAPALWAEETDARLRTLIPALCSAVATLPAEDRRAGRKALLALRDGLAATTAKGKVDASTRSWWQQVLASLAADVEVHHGFVVHGATDRAANDARDAQMAANLVALAEVCYAKRKIIVWAATYHLVRDGDAMKPRDGKDDEPTAGPMGAAVAKHFGKACFTLGFTAAGGSFGLPWWREAERLAPAAQGSLEALCARAGLQYALVDLRATHAGGAWLAQPLVTSAVAHRPVQAPWARELDALFFLRTMTPND